MQEVDLRRVDAPPDGFKQLWDDGWIQAGIVLAATIAATVIVPILAARL